LPRAKAHQSGKIDLADDYTSKKSREQLIKELYRVPDHGKAEIVDGEIVLLPLAGGTPARATGKIAVHLHDYEDRAKNGITYGSRVAFLVDLPHRGSFCPDVSLYTGPRTGAEFPTQAPIFAIEVRNLNEFGPAFDMQLKSKISDYFQAGALVVWDVDVIEEDVIRVYRAIDPNNPTIYSRGEMAEAEPALPGWTMPVDVIFE
jgi:Uma2 family endonuclease